jgi:hypothetical protein
VLASVPQLHGRKPVRRKKRKMAVRAVWLKKSMTRSTMKGTSLIQMNHDIVFAIELASEP